MDFLREISSFILLIEILSQLAAARQKEQPNVVLHPRVIIYDDTQRSTLTAHIYKSTYFLSLSSSWLLFGRQTKVLINIDKFVNAVCLFADESW